MRNPNASTAIFVPLAVVAASMMTPFPALSAEVDVAGILKVWRQRQDSTRSIEFEWTDRKSVPKGHYSKQEALAFPELREKLSKEHNPPEDLVFDRPVKLLLDGERLRYSYENKAWRSKEKRYVLSPHTSTFDGETSVIYNEAGVNPFPTGVINAEKWNADSGIYHQRPLLMTFRAFNSRMSRIDTEQLRMLDQRALVQGRNCRILEQIKGRSDNRVLYYVDPERDCTILRFTEERGGRLECQIDISYIRDEQFGWIPNSWSLVWERLKEAGPETIRATVNRYAINPVLDIERFRVEFPPGTWVTDGRTTPSSMHLVKEDGKSRPIPRSEASASYEQLKNSEPGEAFIQPKQNSRWWMWVVGGACLLGAVLVLIRWKRSKYSAVLSKAAPSSMDAK